MKVSPARRLMIDFMNSAAGFPSITAERRMRLGPVAEAQRAASRRPPWVAIFAKAYGLVAREFPQLRWAFLKFPWQHFCEYPISVAAIAVERTVGDEPAVFLQQITDPASRPLVELSDLVWRQRSGDVCPSSDLGWYLRFARLPRTVRRVLFWLGLNIDFIRAARFGTFAITTVSSFGASLLNPRAPFTTVLTYGLFSSDDGLDVRIIFDHRVIDGATVARALMRLEEILNGPIAEELRGLSATSTKSAEFTCLPAAIQRQHELPPLE